MKLIRYELEFQGEPQGVGFIQGLKDQAICSKTIDNLINCFDSELNIPDYSTFKREKGKYIASFFTEKGLDKFKESINNIVFYIDEQGNGFSVAKKVLEINTMENIVYQDDYQVLIYINY